MATPIKAPVPQSPLSYDESGKPKREWYEFWEALGKIANPLASLPLARIWIGDASSAPIAHSVSGDVTLSSVGVVTLQATANTAEIAQDAVGAILVDSSTIDFTYTDATPAITASVKTGSIGPTELASTAVTPGSYTNTNLTVDADGRLTAASSGSGTFVYRRTFDARLTLTSGVPVTTADVTAAATIYLAPYAGNDIALYTASAWTLYALTEISLSLSGLIKGVLYDIFCYDSGGNPTLESLAWKKVAASNSPTAGSSKTINLADTATLAIGMYVSVKDGSASEIAQITAVVASTSITVATLANSYTTPDVYGYQTRATALTTQDSVYVKTGATDRRYVGTIRINSTGGQTEDSTVKRYVYNYYNRVSRSLSRVEPTATWNYTLATYHQANASTANQVEIVVGVVEDSVDVHVGGISSTASTNIRAAVGIGINSVVTDSATVTMACLTAAANNELGEHAFYSGFPSAAGYYYYAWLEQSTATGTTSWYGTSGPYKTGMTGSWMC